MSLETASQLTYDPAAIPAEAVLNPSAGSILRGRIFGHAGLMIGSTVLLAIVLMALLAPWLAPHDPYAQDLSRRLIPPIWHAKGNWTFPLGTDPLGRDYLSRLIYGAQISLLIGIAVMIISGLIGTVMGVLAGYFGGRTDLFVTYLITVRLSLPVSLSPSPWWRWSAARSGWSSWFWACSNGTASPW